VAYNDLNDKDFWGWYIDNSFTYHPPEPGQPEIYQAIRDKAKELAVLIMDMAPDCSARNRAIVKVEEAVMWANASIARE
jgi:hypothetical protein